MGWSVYIITVFILNQINTPIYKKRKIYNIPYTFYN